MITDMYREDKQSVGNPVSLHYRADGELKHRLCPADRRVAALCEDEHRNIRSSDEEWTIVQVRSVDAGRTMRLVYTWQLVPDLH